MIFKCEYCGFESKEQSKVDVCERSHLTEVRIGKLHFRYGYKYPQEITLYSIYGEKKYKVVD